MDIPSADWRANGAEWDQQGNSLQSPAAADSYLVSAETFHDLTLTVEFFPIGNVNSGVFIRCTDPSDITPMNCLEANIWDEHPRQEFRTGALVMRAAPPLARVDTQGRWNTMEILAAGAAVEVRVNGVLTARYEDPAPVAGHIALQRLGEGSIRFRQLSIEAR